MFGATNIVKNSDKSKYMYSSCGIAFDGAGLWSRGNGFTKKFVIFGVGNGSSFHTNNLKNNFLVLGEGLTDNINGNVGLVEKRLSNNFNKTKAKILLKFAL